LTFLAGSFNISGVGLDRSRPAFKAFRPSTALRPSVGSRGFLAKCLFPQVQHPAAALEQSMPAKIFSILSPGNRTTAGKPIPTPIRATIVLAVGIGIGMLRPACAEEIRLLSAASMQTVLAEIVGDFERNSGHKLTIQYNTMGAITDRVSGGEQADLVISSPASIATLASRGKIDAKTPVTIARTGVGIVVPAGTPKPAITGIDDFRRALLAAKVIVYANPAGGGAAGIHVARLIAKLGLADELKPKIKLGAGGDVTEVTLAQGEGALGVTQVSEIVGKPGAQLVSLPDELQNYTGFVAGIPAGAKQSEAVAAFITFLKSPGAIAVIKAKGMQIE
jgi:molybdate transport system substrate-binding protein